MADNQIDVRLVAEDSGFSSAIAEAKNSLSSLAPAAAEAGGAAEEFGGSLERVLEIAEGFGVFELITSLLEKVKEAFHSVTTEATEWGEKLENLSSETGISVGHLQEFQFATKATGVEMEGLVAFSSRLSRALLELGASTRGSRVESVLAAAGLKASDLNDSYTAIVKIGDAINRLGEGSTAARALLTELGGRGALRLEPAIAQFREFADEAQRMGLVLDSSLVRQLADAQEKFNVLGAVIQVDAERIGAALTPAMEVFAGVLTQGAEQLNVWLQTGTHMQEVTRAVGDALISGAEGLVQFSSDLSSLVGYIRTAVEAFLYLGRTLDLVAAGIAVIHGDTATAGILLAEAEGIKTIGDATDPVIAKLEALRNTLHEATSGLGATSIVGPEAPVAAPKFAPPAGEAGAAKRVADERFRIFEDEQKVEAAAAGNTAEAKIAADQRVTEAAKAAFGAHSTEYLSALARTLSEEDSLRKTQTSQNISELHRQMAEQKTLYEQEVRDAKEALAEQLAATRAAGDQRIGLLEAQRTAVSTAPQSVLETAVPALGQQDRLAQELSVDRQIAAARQDMFSQLMAQSGITGKQWEDYERQRANVSRESSQKIIEDYNSAFTQMQASIQGAIDIFTGPLNSAIDGLITGTETVGQAFRRMALSIVEDLIRIAIEMAVVATARIGAGLVQGAGAAGGAGAGGLLGGAAAAPQAVATGLNTTAITANTTAVAANTAALAGHAVGTAAGGAGAGVAAGAAAAQTTAIAAQTAILTLIESTLLTMASTLITLGFELSTLSIGQLTQDQLLIGIIGQLILLNAKPSFFGTTYQAGGTVPGSGPIPAILHGGERVLSVDEVRHGLRPIAVRSDSPIEEGGGHIVNVNNYINAHDSRGFDKLLKSHRGTFEKMIRDNVR